MKLGSSQASVVDRSRIPHMAVCAVALIAWLPLVGHAGTVRDNFDTVSYAGNNGSANWSANWLEINEADGPARGDEQVVADAGSNRLRVKDHNGGGEGVQREADLSGNAFAILSFDYRRSGLDNANDYVTVEVSSDGGASWTELDRLAGPANDGAYQSALYNISAYASANTRIRFLSSPTLGNNDIIYFDNVEIYYQATAPTLPAPVGEWRMDEFSWNGTAGEVVDNGANGLNGVAVAGAVPDIGYLCNAASLNGTTQYVEVADNALLDIGGELSVTAWVNANTLPTGGNLKTIVSKDTNYEFHLTSAGEVYWWWNDVNGTARSLTTSGAGITAGTWHHVAIVYSSSAATQRIYVDGILRASASFSEALIANNDPLQIGADQGFAGRQFDGRIDEVNVFNAALSQYQVIAAMTATRSCPTATALAYYAMDEASWNGTAGEVVDSSGNGNNGTRVGNAQTIDPAPNPTPIAPGNCRAGAILNEGDSIDTGVDVDGAMGNKGTVTFWFRPNWSQSGGERNIARVLFDASAGSKFFKLAKLNNTNNLYPSNNARRRLALLFEDSADNNFVAYTSAEPSFSANTWVHIAVTWDFPGNHFQIYLDGVLAADQTINTNGAIPALDTLYFGDTRSGYNPFGVTTVADGAFDEVRLYNSVLTQAAIVADRNAAHACVTADHFALSHSGTGVTCQAEPVTVTAHDAVHAVATGYTGTVALSTSTGRGDWSLITGSGVLDNGTTNDGVATYTFAAADGGTAVLGLKHTVSGSVNINVADGSITETSGTATAAEDPLLTFADSGFRFVDAANVENIATQVGGQASGTYYLQAIRTDTRTGACVGVFGAGQTVNIDLASQCNDPTTCNGRLVTFTNDAVNTVLAANPNTGVTSYTTMPVTFLNDGTSRAAFTFNYPDVGKMSLHARYNIPLGVGSSSATNMIGASNPFVVKPFGFLLSNLVRTSDGFANPGAPDAAGAAFIGAGQPFSVTATAVLADGLTTAPNYGRETTPEGVRLTNALVAPVGGSNPALGNATGFGGFANGVATGANFNWDEVGIITLTPGIGDADYLGAGDVAGITSGNVGRFTPDHFDTARTEACVAGGFTYSGEAFAVTVSAFNALNAPTVNYEGAFAKDVTISDAGNTANFTNNVLSGVFAAGVGSSNTIAYTFPAKETPPATLALRAIDQDNVSSSGHNEATSVQRSGRLVFQNAFGSELVDLNVPMRVQYYKDSGSGWITNPDGFCTQVDLNFANFAGNLASGETCVWDAANKSSEACATAGPGAEQYQEPPVAGKFNLYLKAPGSGNEGSVDVTADLSALPWLRYDWDGDGMSDDDPTGHAAFGIYKGSPRQIYLRERY
jgi:MSHA biogenesis protein MshQ